MTACALWQGSRRLVAVIVDEDGQLRRPITTPCTPANCAHLLDYLATAEVDTVIVVERSASLIAIAHAAKLRVHTVPRDLFEAIRAATGFNRRPQRDTAMLLARWHLTPVLRAHLRELRPPTLPAKQLQLL